MFRRRMLAMAALLTLCAADSARADITAFLGAATTPVNRMTKGVAVGLGLLVIGFEFEYAATPEDPASQAPSLTTGMGNVLAQLPVPVFGIQPYATAGIGLYSEELGAHDILDVALNTGGGAKINLAGPLRLRADYRVFTLRGGALYSPAHRIYIGLNLKF